MCVAVSTDRSEIPLLVLHGFSNRLWTFHFDTASDLPTKKQGSSVSWTEGATTGVSHEGSPWAYRGTSQIQAHAKYPSENTNEPELNSALDNTHTSLLSAAVSLTDKCK